MANVVVAAVADTAATVIATTVVVVAVAVSVVLQIILIMAREPDYSRRPNRAGDAQMLTSFVFRVRNIPAALYKAMGGFATNGVNMTKLESYMVDGVFTATQFYADVQGHPDDPALARALDELRYFTSSLKILGVYPADPLRADQAR